MKVRKVDFNFLLKPPFKLDKHQEEGVKFSLLHHYSLNCDDMGLGKTLQALTVAFYHQRKIRRTCLVVCPAYLRLNIENEINQFSKTPKKIKVVESHKEVPGLDKYELDFIICSYNCIREAPNLMKDCPLVICDEVHMLKTPDARVTERFHEALETFNPSVFIGLSGTPIKNRVPEFYSLLCLCSYNPRRTSGTNVLERYDFESFKKEFCFAHKMKIRGRIIKKYYGLKNKDKLKLLLKNKLIRRTNEVLNLKDPIHRDIIVDRSENKKLLAAWENFNRGVKKSVDSSIKKKAALVNTPTTISLATDIHEEGDPVAIVSCHPEALEKIASKLKGKTAIIDGNTPMKERQNYVDSFQNGDLDYILLSLAGSTGITLTKSNKMIFNDESWVPEDNSQWRGRINRKGQTRRCIYYYVRGSKAEKIISQKIREKKATINQVWEEE